MFHSITISPNVNFDYIEKFEIPFLNDLLSHNYTSAQMKSIVYIRIEYYRRNIDVLRYNDDNYFFVNLASNIVNFLLCKRTKYIYYQNHLAEFYNTLTQSSISKDLKLSSSVKATFLSLLYGLYIFVAQKLKLIEHIYGPYDC